MLSVDMPGRPESGEDFSSPSGRLSSQNPIWKKAPTGEVARGLVEGIRHAHPDQDALHVKLLLQLEAGQGHLDLHHVHHVWTGPLSQVVIGEQLLQLRGT